MNTKLSYEERIKRERYLRRKRIQKERRQNFICFLIFSIVMIGSILLTIDFIRFPECYLTTWRYQLRNDIESGDQQMIDYYKNTYIANDRILYSDLNVK